jgi:hypothetical protein
MQLEIIVDKALNRGNNIAGFKRAGIHPVNRELVTHQLPLNCPAYFETHVVRTTLFQINSKLVTDEKFLQEWDQHDEKKLKEKMEKREQKEEKQRRKEEKKNRNKELNESNHSFFFVRLILIIWYLFNFFFYSVI